MGQKGMRKSRCGCLACRSKKIKCDETKPACKTCTSRGHQCPGYKRPLKWSTKYEVNFKSNTETITSAKYSHRSDWSEETARNFNQARSCIASHPQVRRELVSSISEFEPSHIDFVPDENLDSNWQFLDDNGGRTGANHASVPIDYEINSSEQDLDVALWTLSDVWVANDPRFENLSSFTPTENHSVSTSEFGTFLRIDDNDRDQPQNDEMSIEGGQSSSNIDFEEESRRYYQQDVTRHLRHIPTSLIEYWFDVVCERWNAFDSEKNFNRTIALQMFAHSEALAYSLQSMAAAYLSETLPSFRSTTIALTQSAVHAIRKDLNRGMCFDILPQHLLLSMFCVGTSACWIEPLQFGLPFLKEIKTILRTYNMSHPSVALEHEAAFDFFKNSCLYWDMLCNFVGIEDTGEMTSSSSSLFESTAHLPRRSNLENIHPWTGSSTTILILFSQAISICRRARMRQTQNRRINAQSLREALKDIERAQDLHQKVEFLEISPEQDIDDTDDKLTPRSHFCQIAELYRIAALVQLQQTFPDLALASDTVDVNDTNSEERVLELGLRMIHSLESIPLTSRTRCIQPVLCLTAASVLRLGIPLTDPEQSSLVAYNAILSSDLKNSSPTNTDHSESVTPVYHVERDTLSVTRILEVERARRFILARLSYLESCLPMKPIQVAKQLVQTMWRTYDNEDATNTRTHWIDIMTTHNLRTIFG